MVWRGQGSIYTSSHLVNTMHKPTLKVGSYQNWMAALMSAPIYFTSKEGLLPIHDQFSLVNQQKKKHVSISFIYNTTIYYLWAHWKIQISFQWFISRSRRLSLAQAEAELSRSCGWSSVQGLHWLGPLAQAWPDILFSQWWFDKINTYRRSKRPSWWIPPSADQISWRGHEDRRAPTSPGPPAPGHLPPR